VGGDMPMAALPLGTLNHFARDLGVPAELEAAAQAIARGTRTRIDVGSVNGRAFLNNASVGLYPEMVVHREHEQAHNGRAKFTAMMVASRRVLQRFPLLRVRLTMPTRELELKTPLLFVGNNEYHVRGMQLGRRTALDQGCLSVYSLRCHNRAQMFWLMMRAVMQRLDDVANFENDLVTHATVELHHKRLRVALDGELHDLQTPLQFAIQPRALPVIAPAVATEQPAEPARGAA
jgi:diacylglycerol kinase family enzyme